MDVFGPGPTIYIVLLRIIIVQSGGASRGRVCHQRAIPSSFVIVSFVTHEHQQVISLIYGQESPGWISLCKLVTFFLFLKINKNINLFGKIDWPMNSGRPWAGYS